MLQKLPFKPFLSRATLLWKLEMCRVDFIDEENYFSIQNMKKERWGINVRLECHTSGNAIKDNPLKAEERFSMRIARDLKDVKWQAK